MLKSNDILQGATEKYMCNSDGDVALASERDVVLE